MSSVPEIPPAKNQNQKQADKAPRRKAPKKQTPPKQKRNVLTNNAPTRSLNSDNPQQKRILGQYIVGDVLSAKHQSIYIDRLGLHKVSGLVNAFALYEKYFVNNVELEFIPSQPVTVGGTIYMAPDYDPLDPASSDHTFMSRAYNYVQKPITSGCRCKMPNLKIAGGNTMRPPLFSGPGETERFTSYGKFNIQSTSSLADNTVMGALVLHYDITFILQQPADTSAITQLLRDVSVKSVFNSNIKCAAMDSETTTNLDGFELFNIAHAAAESILKGDYTWSGIVKSLTAGLSVTTRAGKPINAGTRIFFGPKKFSHIADSIQPLDMDSNQSRIGWMNLSRDNSTTTELLFDRTGLSYMDLTDVTYFY